MSRICRWMCCATRKNGVWFHRVMHTLYCPHTTGFHRHFAVISRHNLKQFNLLVRVLGGIWWHTETVDKYGSVILLFNFLYVSFLYDRFLYFEVYMVHFLYDSLFIHSIFHNSTFIFSKMVKKTWDTLSLKGYIWNFLNQLRTWRDKCPFWTLKITSCIQVYIIHAQHNYQGYFYRVKS